MNGKTYSGRLMTLKGVYRVIDAPSLEAAWAGVKRLEEQDAEQLRVAGRLAVERERRFRGRSRAAANLG